MLIQQIYSYLKLALLTVTAVVYSCFIQRLFNFSDEVLGVMFCRFDRLKKLNSIIMRESVIFRTLIHLFIFHVAMYEIGFPIRVTNAIAIKNFLQLVASIFGNYLRTYLILRHVNLDQVIHEFVATNFVESAQ